MQKIMQKTEVEMKAQLFINQLNFIMPNYFL